MGSITIETNKLRVAGAEILAAVFGSGQSGDIIIQATNSVELSGEIPGGNNRSPGGIFAQIERNAEGSSGNLTIGTRRLSVSDGSKVQTITFGKGNAGDLKINTDSVEVFETPKYNYFETGIFAGVGIDSRSTNLAQGRVGFQPSSLKADPQALQGNNRPDVNATGQISSVTVNIPDNSLIQNSLTEFPQTFTDTTQLACQ